MEWGRTQAKRRQKKRFRKRETLKTGTNKKQ